MSGGSQFVPGRDLCNQILTSRPNPDVMASIEPVEQAGDDKPAASPVWCPTCNGSRIVHYSSWDEGSPCPECGEDDTECTQPLCYGGVLVHPDSADDPIPMGPCPDCSERDNTDGAS